MEDLSLHQRAVKLAAKTGFSPRTCLRWLTHERVGVGISRSCETAAKRLGLERAEVEK